MVVEGRGTVSPAPIEVRLNSGDFIHIAELARRIARAKYAHRDDTWSAGLRCGMTLTFGGRLDSRERPIFVGKLAEHAVRYLAARRFPGLVSEVNNDILPYGDGGVDLTILGYGLQLKLRQKHTLPNMVKRVKGSGHSRRIIPLGGDGSVFCQWIYEQNFVSVLGWLPNRDVAAHPLSESHLGDWQNYAFPDLDLLPMARLWAEIESRRTEVNR